MSSFISEVLPAIAAMIVMALAAIFLFVVFETLRSHLRTAFARTNTRPLVEQVRIETPLSDTREKIDLAEEAAPELPYDRDADMFAGDFANTPQPLPEPEAPSDAGDDKVVLAAETVGTEQDAEPEPASNAQSEQSGVAPEMTAEQGGRRNREGKQRRREREGSGERRTRKAEKSQRPEAAPEEARKLRQENRRRNSQ